MESNKHLNINVIKFLNRMGYPILEICERYYIISLFEEASNNSWKHYLQGKDITSVISDFIHIHTLDDAQRPAIIQKIETCVNVKKYFHKDILYILHLE